MPTYTLLELCTQQSYLFPDSIPRLHSQTPFSDSILRLYFQTPFSDSYLRFHSVSQIAGFISERLEKLGAGLSIGMAELEADLII